MKVLVCGGRDYADQLAAFKALDALHEMDPATGLGRITLVIHGACCALGDHTELRGGDRFGQEWAQIREVPYLGVPARWLTEFKRAGMERNWRMLDYGPEYVVAFPGGRGTANMIDVAKERGLTVWQPYG